MIGKKSGQINMTRGKKLMAIIFRNGVTILQCEIITYPRKYMLPCRLYLLAIINKMREITKIVFNKQIFIGASIIFKPVNKTASKIQIPEISAAGKIQWNV